MDNIQNHNISFKGMSTQSINRFIPELDDFSTKKLARILEHELPYDVFEVVGEKNSSLLHLRKFGDRKYPLGTIQYKGDESVVKKLRFLMAITNKIKYGFYTKKKG